MDILLKQTYGYIKNKKERKYSDKKKYFYYIRHYYERVACDLLVSRN